MRAHRGDGQPERVAHYKEHKLVDYTATQPMRTNRQGLLVTDKSFFVFSNDYFFIYFPGWFIYLFSMYLVILVLWMGFFCFFFIPASSDLSETSHSC